MTEEAIKIKEVFDIYVSQNNAIDELWKFYSTVALALLAAAVSSDHLKASKLGVFAVLMGFWVFSVGNLSVLRKTQTVALEAASAFNILASHESKIDQIRITPTELSDMTKYHLICDISLSIAILAISRRYRIDKKSAPPK